MSLLKSLLLGSKLRILLTGVLALGVVGAGAFSLGLLGAPGVAGVHNSFGNVTDETTEIRTELAVTNPNPIGANLGDVSIAYDVRMNDVAMANGTKEGVSIGTGNSTVSFQTEMRNDRIPPWWVSHIRNGERTTVRIDAVVESGTLGRSFEAPPIERSVSTDLISAFNSTEDRPVNASQPGISDPVAYVNETSASWGEVADARTPIDMRFTVYNAKTLPIAITEIGYNVTMNDVNVGSGATDREYVIEGRTTETIDAETAVRNDRLDDWWVTHLERNQVTDLRIDFYAEIEVAGQTYRVPLEELTYEETVETDIFGTKDETDGAANETTAASESDGESSDDGETATTDETTTAADESTTSDDGTTATSDDGSSGGETTTDDGLLSRSAVVA